MELALLKAARAILCLLWGFGGWFGTLVLSGKMGCSLFDFGAGWGRKNGVIFLFKKTT